MSIRDLSPDKLLQQAMRLIEMGRLDTALKLLKVASLKAPGDQHIQNTLAQVQEVLNAQPPTQEDEDAGLESLYSAAQANMDAGDLDQAAKALQVLVAARPKERRFRELQNEVRARRAGKQRRDIGVDFITKTKLADLVADKEWEAAETLLRDRLKEHRDSAELNYQLALVLVYGQQSPRAGIAVTKEAVRLAPERIEARLVHADALREMDQKAAAEEARAAADKLAAPTEVNVDAVRIQMMSPFSDTVRVSDAASAVTAPDARSQLWKAVLLVALLATLGGTWGTMWWSKQSTTVDVSTYQQVLPVSSALALPHNGELQLILAQGEWAGLDEPARRAKLADLYVLAAKNGYDVVFIATSTNTILGSARKGLVWLPD